MRVNTTVNDEQVEKFRERLAYLLRGREQEEVAQLWGINVNTLRGWLYCKTGRYPSMSAALEICKLENCSLDFLMGLTSEEIMRKDGELIRAINILARKKPRNRTQAVQIQAMIAALKWVLDGERAEKLAYKKMEVSDE